MGVLHAEVLNGHYPSLDDAMAEAVRLQLQQRRRMESNATDDPPAPNADQLADQEAQQRLFAAGLLSEIRPPSRVATGTDQFKPVTIQGEPLSETIIRERR